jgi:hypothetical protein
MAKQIVATEIPAEDVDDIVTAFQNLGATDITKTQQSDGTYTVQATFSA